MACWVRRPLDGLLDSTGCSAFCGLSYTKEVVEVNNGFIGSVPNHPLLQQLVNSIAEMPLEALPGSGDHDKVPSIGNIAAFLDPAQAAAVHQIERDRVAMEIITRTGPGLFTKQVFEHLQFGRSPTIRVLPKYVLHCVPNQVQVDIKDKDVLAKVKEKYVRESTFAVHWWQQSWK